MTAHMQDILHHELEHDIAIGFTGRQECGCVAIYGPRVLGIASVLMAMQADRADLQSHCGKCGPCMEW